MTILIAGGLGKVGDELATILTQRKIPFIVGSRGGQAGLPAGYKGVKLDWNDVSTYPNPFDADASIDRVYIAIAAPVRDQLTIVKPFVELAKQRGVKRVVFVSATIVERGELPHGTVHDWLADESGLEFAILRPTWFFENLVQQRRIPIRDQRVIDSAAQDGKVAFVSCIDIAEAAVDALTREKSTNTDHLILGPELFSYGEVADILTRVLGEKVAFVPLTAEQLSQKYIPYGLPKEYAAWLAKADADVATGTEERLFNDDIPNKIIGKRRLEDFIIENKSVWQKA